MVDRIEKLERQVAELASEVAALKANLCSGSRVADPKERAGAVCNAAEPAGGSSEGWAISRDFERLVAEHGLVILAGIASLVLAVAVVLRQATINSDLPVAFGAALGLAYCTLLMAISFLRYRKGAGLQGDVFLVLATAILNAILVEVTLRPDGFTRTVSYAVLATALVILAVISLRNGRAVPFTACVLAAPIAGAAIGGRPFQHPLFATILGMSLLLSWVGSILRGFGRIRWFTGFLTLSYVFTLGALAKTALRPDMAQHALARPVPALSVLAGLLLILLLPAVVASLKRHRSLDAFEVTTAVAGPLAVLVAGTGILLALPSGARVAGLACLGLGILFYVTAAIGFIRHGAESRSFYVLSINALVYVLAGFAFLTGGGVAYGVTVQGAALVLSIFALKLGKRTLSVQAFLLTCLAFLVNAKTGIDLSAPGDGLATRIGPAVWLIISGVMATFVFVFQRAFRWDSQRFSLKRLNAHATALVVALAIGQIQLLSGLLPLIYDLVIGIVGTADPETLSDVWHTIYTLLLVSGSLMTLGLAVRLRLGGATVLAAVVMVAAGLKLFLHDAMTVHWTLLAFSASAFGLSLIAASLLYRRFRGISASQRPRPTPSLPGRRTETPDRTAEAGGRG